MLRLAMALSLLWVGIPVLSAQNPPNWKYQASKDIKHFEMTSRGDLFVSTDREVFLLDGKSGAVRWSRTDVRDCEFRQKSGWTSVTWEPGCNYLGKNDSIFSLVPGTPYAVFRPENRVAIINLETGKTLLDSEGRGWGKVLEYLYIEQRVLLQVDLGKDRYEVIAVRLEDNSDEWRTGVLIKTGFTFLGQSDDGNALIYGKNRQNQRILASLDLETRKVDWQSTSLLQSDLADLFPPRPIRSADSGWLVYLNEAGPMRLDRNGNLVWRCSELAGRKPTQMFYDGTRLYIMHPGSVVAVDPEKGSILWRRETAPEATRGLRLHPLGLLLSSAVSVDLLSRDDGKSLWSKPADVSLLSPYVFNENELYVASSAYVSTVDLTDGRVARSSQYTFDYGERPETLEKVDGGLLVSSRQNLALIDKEGRVVYHRHYPPVRESGLLVALRAPIALAVGVATASYNGQRGPMEPGTPGNLPRDFFELRQAEVDVRGDGFAIMHTDQPTPGVRGYSVVRLDKATGDEAGRIWLGDKNPNLYSGPPDNSRPMWEGVRKTNFYFHWSTQMLFLKDGDKRIQAFGF